MYIVHTSYIYIYTHTHRYTYIYKHINILTLCYITKNTYIPKNTIYTQNSDNNIYHTHGLLNTRPYMSHLRGQN